MAKGTPYIQPAQSTEWETPRDLFDKLWEEAGGFDCDPCCTPEQYTAQRALGAGGEIFIPPPPADDGHTVSGPVAGRLDQKVYYDGLRMSWRGKVFMNPPYGLALRKWVPRAAEMVQNGTAESVWALLPSKTDTQWFQAHVVPRILEAPSDVRFLKGRLTFAGAPASAGFASVVVVWRR